MMKSRIFISALAAWLVGTHYPAHAIAAKRNILSREEAYAQLNVAVKSLKNEDCKTVLKLALPLTQTNQNAVLDEKHRDMPYSAVVSCYLDHDEDAKAYPYALKGSRLAKSSTWLWRVRLSLELSTERNIEAAATVEEMALSRPDALNAMPVRWMSSLQNALDDVKTRELRARLLKILVNTSYAPDDLLEIKDWFRLDYARLLHDGDNQKEARVLVGQLSNPYTVMEASLDHRFRADFPVDFSLRKIVEKQLDKDRVIMRGHSDLLDPITNVAADLLLLGRPQDALELFLSVKVKVAVKGAYKDQEEQLNWWWDGLARTYVVLGMPDQAIAAFRVGLTAGEVGEDDVSQAINLAYAQFRFSMPKDALQTLSVFDGASRKASPFGYAELHLARGCANYLAGNHAASAADLAYLKEHRTDHPEAYGDLLLCRNDLEGAAQEFILRLDNPDERIGALLQLSDYNDPPVALPLDPIGSHFPALKARADVKAAIERAGGIRQFDVQPPSL